MVRNYGVRVKSFNISQQQIAFARERAQRLGIGSDRIEYVHDDYRNIPNHVKCVTSSPRSACSSTSGARAMRASTTSSPVA
jgi:cyclopropane fatty-acyl-phospholipid synthase-like methyltransferase